MNKSKEIICAIEGQLGFLKLNRMAETFDEIIRSKDFLEMDKLSVISRMIDAEYQDKSAKLFQKHLRSQCLSWLPSGYLHRTSHLLPS